MKSGMLARWVGIGLVAAVLAGVGTAARAVDLVIGVEDLDYLPHYSSRDGDYGGIARDIFDAFAGDEGLSVHYRPLPIPRLYKSLLDGDIDFKYPDSPDWNKAGKAGAKVVYSMPVVGYVDGTVVPVARLGQPVEGFRKLGTVQGFTPWAWQDRIKAGKVELWENPSFSGLLRQVIMNRADGAYINVAVADFQLRNVLRKPGALAFDPALPHTRDSYFLSTVRHPGVIARFDAWLAGHAELVAGLKRKWELE